ncbi:hypothetical protein [Helicobacter sp. MIT 05-5294]|uniref:hypothetical protein n=1 Tax=Helicobacter sp. MIT 05-5294 TaxID=1548150 RepID=UPI000A688786|nr:hypothetical protein [Helicobacter sp. MIT 05-5294]
MSVRLTLGFDFCYCKESSTASLRDFAEVVAIHNLKSRQKVFYSNPFSLIS